jgi:hypothetical protein
MGFAYIKRGQEVKDMQSTAERIYDDDHDFKKYAVVETDLYSLIEAVQERVPRGEDRVVAAIVADIINRGNVRLRGEMKGRPVKIVQDITDTLICKPRP